MCWVDWFYFAYQILCLSLLDLYRFSRVPVGESQKNLKIRRKLYYGRSPAKMFKLTLARRNLLTVKCLIYALSGSFGSFISVLKIRYDALGPMAVYLW